MYSTSWQQCGVHASASQTWPSDHRPMLVGCGPGQHNLCDRATLNNLCVVQMAAPPWSWAPQRSRRRWHPAQLVMACVSSRWGRQPWASSTWWVMTLSVTGTTATHNFQLCYKGCQRALQGSCLGRGLCKGYQNADKHHRALAASQQQVLVQVGACCGGTRAWTLQARLPPGTSFDPQEDKGGARV